MRHDAYSAKGDGQRELETASESAISFSERTVTNQTDRQRMAALRKVGFLLGSSQETE